MILPVAPGFEYEAQQVWLPASEGIMGWGTGFHDLMLNDHIRMAAFREAIAESVRPGMTVLDLGTGTGVLARWALEAGAARVYGIDLNETVLRAAVDQLTEAGYGDRFVPLCDLSYQVTLPERVDLIVSEIMGNLVDNEDCVTILNDARKRFLKPGGAMLPRRVESYLVPVGAEHAHDRVRRRDHQAGADPGEVDDALLRRGVNSPFDLYYDTILPAATYLATPRVLRLHRLDEDTSPEYAEHLGFTVSAPGLLTGFKGYFIATLSDHVTLDIAGDDITGRTTSDSWKHCYLPIEEPIAVRPHDRVRLDFSRTKVATPGSPFQQIYRWSGQVRRGPAVVGTFAQASASTD